jgi:RNA polymerase sigma factor (sigma-70 family)
VCATIQRARLDDPADLVAEVTVRAWRRYRLLNPAALRTSLDEEARWSRWFIRIAERIVLDEVRRQERFDRGRGVRAFERLSDEGDDASTLGSYGPVEVDHLPDEQRLGDPDLQLERAEARDLLGKALGQLPALDRALLLRWGGGVSDAETAASLSLDVHDLRRRRYRAIWRLRDVFRRHGYPVPIRTSTRSLAL